MQILTLSTSLVEHISSIRINRMTKLKVHNMWFRYRPGVAQRVGRGITLLFHDRGTRRGEWSAARPGRTLPPGKDTVSILQEAGWAPGPVWRGEKTRPHWDSIPDRPAFTICTTTYDLTMYRFSSYIFVT